MLSRLFVFTVLILCSASAASAAFPEPWQFNLQPGASPVKEKMHEFHNLMLYVMVGITAFVLLLLTYVCLRFRASVNPNPSKTSHNTLIEIIWTAVPVIILVIIAIPSFRLLYYTDKIEEPDMTLKVIGYQWYWGYEYPDHGGFAFDSYMIKDEDLKEGDIRLLEVDNRVVVPVDQNIRVLITAADVLHSWAVPALGVKTDAVPGRLNETWMRITKPGVYYGQCSELCGVLHGFMPIAVEAVSEEEFNAWVAEKKEEAGIVDAPETEAAETAEEEAQPAEEAAEEEDV